MKLKRTMIATAVYFACEVIGRDWRNTQKINAISAAQRHVQP